MSQCETWSSRYASLPEVPKQPQEEEPPLLQEDEDNTLQNFLWDPPPHADTMFRHISSNLATPSQNAASTSNTTLTNHPANLNLVVNPVVNPVFNLAINPAINPVPNPLAMPPAPAGIDPATWAHNQALIMSLLPTLQTLTLQNHPPPRPPKEGDAQAPVKFLGDQNSKL